MPSETKPAAAPDTTLRLCAHCHKGPEKGAQLRRCAGCAITTSVMYCSKECQRAAWPTHKTFCRLDNEHRPMEDRLNQEVQCFGYQTSASFSKAFEEYQSAHQWALDRAGFAQILLKSGTQMEVVRHQPPREMLVFFFHAQPTGRSQYNPATTFKLARQGFRSIDEYARAHKENAAAVASLLKSCADIHAAELEKNDPYYLGLVPTLYVVEGVSLQISSILPISGRAQADSPLDDADRAALSDFIRLCTNSMNHGLPLRVNNPRLRFYPVPGRFVRRAKGNWVWEPLFDSWEDYYRGRASCGRLQVLEGQTTGFFPLKLMSIMAAFWSVEGSSESP
ncbi:hypothetical protein BC628DRAFT_1311361 [Trametes gibbosa]|uniref:MYND-type domain-containing protein n=1 Tax=Trametes gibbosa TaxID=160864 RepID=A0A6G6FSA2_9APHY|nr:hypothetical protein BC628DRAFT_1311361 [Trametes gibbosa]QIE48461.1 hypothetical protein [Trametes gibbosa]